MSKFVFYFCLIILSILAGCQGPYKGSRTSHTLLEHQENLVYTDLSLREKIPCEVLEAKSLESGRTEIYARFYNKQNITAECQIQLKFKDKSGKIVDETGWMPLLLPRREVTEFRHISLASHPADFVLMLRMAK